ncbi:MAG: DNA repair protein RecO [Balneolaceae bacterium]
MITKTEAIVLRAVDYQESSLIATLFTRKDGKIAVIAKGARRPKSKFSAFLVPGQYLEVIYYMKSTRSVQTLSDASYVQKLDRLRVDMEKMALAVSTLEMVSQIVHENEVNEPVFHFLQNFLPWLNETENITKKIFPYVQIRLAGLVGIGLQPEFPGGTIPEKGYINIETGSLSGEQEGEEVLPLSPAQFTFVYKSLHSASLSILEINLTASELSVLIEHLDKYFRYHIEGMSPRKSDTVFDQLLKD